MNAAHIGNIVHYVMDEGNYAGQCRPAIVVRLWNANPEGALQLQVLIDGTNDIARPGVETGGLLWKTSRQQDPTGQKQGFWHFYQDCPTEGT